jgi:hypothetical protein
MKKLFHLGISSLSATLAPARQPQASTQTRDLLPVGQPPGMLPAHGRLVPATGTSSGAAGNQYGTYGLLIVEGKNISALSFAPQQRMLLKSRQLRARPGAKSLVRARSPEFRAGSKEQCCGFSPGPGTGGEDAET